MNVDKTTGLEFIWISIEDKERYLNQLRKVSNENQEEPHLLILDDGHSFESGEYYFEENSEGKPVINFSGEYKGSEGNSCISFNLPLSDPVLIDILSYAVKKLNRLKTAMEALK